MNCPKCHTAAATKVARTGVFGPSVLRTRQCDACAVEWQTEETRRGDYTPLPVAAGAHRQPPVTAGGRGLSSDLSLSLNLFSESSPDSYQNSGRDRQCDEAGTRALAVVKPAAVAKSSLYEQIAGQFQAAYFVERGCDYMLTAADRSQIGRFLSPGKGNQPPSPELLAELPAIFTAFAAETREFERRQGLAWLLTKGLNIYREAAKGLKPRHVSPKSRSQIENLQAIAERGRNRE